MHGGGGEGDLVRQVLDGALVVRLQEVEELQVVGVEFTRHVAALTFSQPMATVREIHAARSSETAFFRAE
jgi:hypothetical protein